VKPTSLLTPPASEDVVIHLIREELKSHHFFDGLRKLGLDDDFYQVDLIELIMAGVGLPIEQDHQNYCYHLLKKRSARVTQDTAELIDEARRVYFMLVKYTLYNTNKNEM